MKAEHSRKNKQLLALWTAGLAVLLGLLAMFSSWPVSTDILQMRHLLEEDGHIIHAGGFLGEGDRLVSYTNSLEALDNLYEKGNRFCEIDLLETSDGVLICGHTDEQGKIYGTDLSIDTTAEEFLNSSIFEQYTSISLANLADYMRTHPDLRVITDVKCDNLRVCESIAEDYPELMDQFLVQIQLPEEYETISKFGFQYIVYPIFKTPDAQRGVLKLRSFANNHPLVALVVPNGYYAPDWKLALASKIIQVPIILHTLNDQWEIDYYLNHGLAAAVYTDLTEF